ncbi:MAG: hypothetical protein H7X71_07340 [Chitinophagales bacterium]|nr:hypothetical protein [Chitinophagales bacterium]
MLIFSIIGIGVTMKEGMRNFYNEIKIEDLCNTNLNLHTIATRHPDPDNYRVYSTKINM